eukprot:GEZU01012372.1.p1 GENE.GEZU01012372.1~~GEZU01012372.1.p1  ORF type:complete len:200 (+),score=95.01 GEZU01012372.1:71-670(+)
MGEVPDRAIFRQKGMKKPLRPYLHLTKAVRVGDVLQFRDVVNDNANTFIADKTYTLIQRIRQNVIKTGLKQISLSYSRISIADICEKLHFDNPEDAEWIVAKAIRDGVIDATIDHDGGFIQSKETIDVYSTNEPAAAFHKRTAFCWNIHNEAVKAMSFPETHKETEEEEKERLKRQREEKELQSILDSEEGDEEDDMED